MVDYTPKIKFHISVIYSSRVGNAMLYDSAINSFRTECNALLATNSI